jgi:hypothetical protein
MCQLNNTTKALAAGACWPIQATQPSLLISLYPPTRQIQHPAPFQAAYRCTVLLPQTHLGWACLCYLMAPLQHGNSVKPCNSMLGTAGIGQHKACSTRMSGNHAMCCMHSGLRQCRQISTASATLINAKPNPGAMLIMMSAAA